MSVILKTKRSSNSGNVPSNLELGELAVNIADRKIWIGTGSEPPVLLSEPPTVEQLFAGDGISINTNNEINFDLSVGLITVPIADKYDKVPILDISNTGVPLGTKLVSTLNFLNYGLANNLSTDVWDGNPATDQRTTIAVQDQNPNAFSIKTLQNDTGSKVDILKIDTSVVGGANTRIAGTELRLEPTTDLIIGLAPLTINAYTISMANLTTMTLGDVSISGVNSITPSESTGNTLYIQGNLVVSGYIETDTGIRGNTNDDPEYLGIGMVVDGGSW